MGPASHATVISKSCREEIRIGESADDSAESRLDAVPGTSNRSLVSCNLKQD
ncbi:hypothetical protein K9M47_04135 [Candidatus Gracilibacteria bacterium]|nr:hypothetical protein [Candidatus Gracilibacteria bacterium]